MTWFKVQDSVFTSATQFPVGAADNLQGWGDLTGSIWNIVAGQNLQPNTATSSNPYSRPNSEYAASANQRHVVFCTTGTANGPIIYVRKQPAANSGYIAWLTVGSVNALQVGVYTAGSVVASGASSSLTIAASTAYIVDFNVTGNVLTATVATQAAPGTVIGTATYTDASNTYGSGTCALAPLQASTPIQESTTYLDTQIVAPNWFPTLASGKVLEWYDKGAGVVQSLGNFTSWLGQRIGNSITVAAGTPTWDAVNQQVVLATAGLTTQALTLAQPFWIAWAGYASGYSSGASAGVQFFGNGSTHTWFVENQHGTSLGDIFFSGDSTLTHKWEGSFSFSGTSINRQIVVFNGTNAAQAYQNGFVIAKASGDGQTGAVGPAAAAILMSIDSTGSADPNTTTSRQRWAFGTVNGTALSAADIALIDNWLVTSQATLGSGSGAMLLMGCGA